MSNEILSPFKIHPLNLRLSFQVRKTCAIMRASLRGSPYEGAQVLESQDYVLNTIRVTENSKRVSFDSKPNRLYNRIKLECNQTGRCKQKEDIKRTIIAGVKL